MSFSKYNLLDKLHTEALKSPIEHQLAATIIKSGKMVTKPCCNSQRNFCRGVYMGSLHAEAHAILNHFGRLLTFDRKKGWCFLPGRKAKVPKT